MIRLRELNTARGTYKKSMVSPETVVKMNSAINNSKCINNIIKYYYHFHLNTKNNIIY